MAGHAVSDCYICQLRLVHRLLPFCGLKLLFACKESKSRRTAPDQHGGVAFRAIGVKDRTVALCQAGEPHAPRTCWTDKGLLGKVTSVTDPAWLFGRKRMHDPQGVRNLARECRERAKT